MMNRRAIEQEIREEIEREKANGTHIGYLEYVRKQDSESFWKAW